MKNIEMNVTEDGILTISVDLSKECGESKSGKNIIIATTEGNMPLSAPHEDVRFGLNVYKTKPVGVTE